MRILYLLAVAMTFAAPYLAYAESEADWLFFPYCIDTHDSMKRSLPEQAAMLKELGFDGVGHLWLDNVKERLETLDAEGLKLFQITLLVNITKEEPYDPRLKEVLPLLKGRDVQLCLLTGGMNPSDTAGDEKGVAIITEIADMALESGTKIVLYPHANDWLEKVDDAIRLAKKVNRPNVGVMFNLCHWLKVDDEENMVPVLKRALPYLWAVSINGADTAASIHEGTGNWLQPLDSGSFDNAKLLKALKELGYTGPIGLQCWGIEGDVKEHLTRSMNAWKKLLVRCNQSDGTESK